MKIWLTLIIISFLILLGLGATFDVRPRADQKLVTAEQIKTFYAYIDDQRDADEMDKKINQWIISHKIDYIDTKTSSSERRLCVTIIYRAQ